LRAPKRAARVFSKKRLTRRNGFPISPHADGASAFERMRGPRGFRANSSSSLPSREAGAERFARLPRARRTRLSTMAIRAAHASRGRRRVPRFRPRPLFDNCIGRKRDVGGGVLAGLCCLGWFRVNGTGAGDGVLKRLLTVTFQNSSRFLR
jgi:hypothetical protein